MRTRSWTDEALRTSVARQPSVANVIRELGLRLSGGNYKQVQARIKELQLDVSHMKGQAWNRGSTAFDDPRVQTGVPLDEIFSEYSPHRGSMLRKWVIKHKLIPYQCASCANAGEWRGSGLTLELDHRNGNNRDNRLENLRFLCPNCHSQTATYKNKRGRQRVVGDDVLVAALAQHQGNIHRTLQSVGMNPTGGNYVRCKLLMVKHQIAIDVQHDQTTSGLVAQSGERLFCKQEAVGS